MWVYLGFASAEYDLVGQFLQNFDGVVQFEPARKDVNARSLLSHDGDGSKLIGLPTPEIGCGRDRPPSKVLWYSCPQRQRAETTPKTLGVAQDRGVGRQRREAWRPVSPQGSLAQTLELMEPSMRERQPYQDPERSTNARLADLMGRMSLEEKVGQMVQADGRCNAREQVETRRVGSFLHILGDDTVELQRLAERTGLGIPLIFGIDAVHGHGFWPGATVFPTQLALSCSWDPELCQIMGRVTAREMSVTGLHWTFSPVLCLARDLRWGRVGETFGEDPFLLGEMGKALVRGYQGESLDAPDSVIACAKHFAGYSETVGGRDATEAEISERKLRTYFLPPFREMVRAGCRSFMSAYQCIDGVACVVNRWLLTDVLREEWGFDGFVVTDWDNVGRTHKQQFLYSSIAAAVPDAVRAGNDMIMVTPEFYDAALEHLRKGTLGVADIDRACERILRHKLLLGLFDHKRYPQTDRIPEVVGSPAHREPLRRAALESIVLLKNGPASGAPVLPFSAAVQRIAVVGPNADDTVAQLGDWSYGSGQTNPPGFAHPRDTVITVLDGLRSRAARAGVEVAYARGADALDPDESGIPSAIELVAAADVAVVVVGDALARVGEECDVSDLELSGGQQALLRAVEATGKPLVVILVNSKPLCISWCVEHADAILEAFNPGMRGGEAIAELLFGDACPSGKLSISFPKTIGAQPAYYQQIPGWHGPRPNTYDAAPLFAFGHGLSYTRFEYSGLRLSTSRVRQGESVVAEVELRNVGARRGAEIAQLYLNDRFTSLSTPGKALKGFRRMELDPGECVTLQFEIPYAELSFPGRDGRPVFEPGEFQVMVGGSSQDDHLLTAVFELHI